ncbi:MAG: tetratricopeptide repeat protein [Candidatus Latescibacterota bacterium]
MILFNILLVALVGGAVGLSTRYFSPQELQDSFEKGQKLYALGDYQKATAHYESILEVQNNATIDVNEVTVDVDEFILPVRVAATYQLANAYNKQGLDKLRRAEFLRQEQNEAEAQERHAEALADLNTSLKYFNEIIGNPRVDERTRVMAQYQMLETSYQLRKYEQVIEEGQNLLRAFPNSVYETATYYDMGWSYYELGQFEQAIASFEQVLRLSPRGSHADRALFQIAECQDTLGHEDEALTYLDRLIHRYDFSQMTEQDLLEMNTLKLKGVVTETSRELVAKAQLKKGDLLAQQGKVQEALQAYAVLPREYAAEKTLAQNSYIRAAELIHRERGTPAAIDAYKNAIENVDDKLFQAQTQLTVARLLYDEGQYEKSAEEYRIYLKAYGDVALRIGFGHDKALFRLAQCHQARGQALRAEDPEGAAAAFAEGLTVYGQLLSAHPESPLVPDALLGSGLSQQFRGRKEEARSHYRELVERFPDHAAAPSGLLQLARLEFEGGDHASARTIYESFLQRYPESELVNAARTDLGVTYQRLGDTQAAIGMLESVDSGWDQWPKVQLQIAELYAGQSDYDHADQALQRALAAAQEGQLRSQLSYSRGKIHFVRGEYEAAIREFGSALQPDPAPEVIDGALYSRGAAHYELARQLDAAGDANRARGHYEACMADLETVLKREDVAAHIKDSSYRTLGTTMIRLGRAEEAARYYRQIIASSSDPQERATFQMLLMELFYDMKDYPRAADYARELLEMEFADDDRAGYFRKERAYAIIGNALLQEPNYPEAARTFGEGFQRFPRSGESANMAFSRGLAEFSSGDYESAAASFDVYLKAFPTDANAMHGWYYLGHSRQVLTEFVRAAEAFSALVDRFPDTPYREEVLFLVGENYYNAQQYPKAIRAYEEFLRAFPQGEQADDAQYAMAWAYIEQKQMEPGVAAMAELVARYPKSDLAPKAQFTVGDYYYNTQAYDQSIAAYDKLVADYPTSENAQRAKDLLRELREVKAGFEYNEVMKSLAEQRYREAVKGFEELITRYPGSYTALASYCNMGMAYESMEDWSKAVGSYDRVLEGAPQVPGSRDVVLFARQHRDWIAKNRL